MLTVLFYFWLFAMPVLGLLALARALMIRRRPGSGALAALGITMVVASLAGWSTLAAGLCEAGQGCSDDETPQTVLWVASALLLAITVAAAVRWRLGRSG